MSAIKFSCPSCRITLKSDKPLPTTKTIGCPNCGKEFNPSTAELIQPRPTNATTPANGVSSTPAVISPAPPLVSSSPAGTPSQPPSSGPSLNLLLFLGAVACLLLVGLGVVVAIVLTRTREKPTTAQGSSSVSDSERAELEKEREQLAREKEKLEKEKKDQAFKQFFTDGKKALQEERAEDAKKAFEKALDISPDDAQARKGLSDAKDLLKEQQSAKNEDEALKFLVDSGKDAMTKKEYASAVRSFEQAVNLRKNDQELYRQLEEARKALDADKAQQAKLKEYNSHMDAGREAMVAQRYQDAVREYTAALGVMPNDAEARKKQRDAERQLDALATDKKNREEYDELVSKGRKALQDRYYNQAVKHFIDAKQLFPNKPEILNMVADAQNKLQLAKQDFNNAVAKGDLAQRAGQYDAAVFSFEEAQSILPEDPRGAQLVALARKARTDAQAAQLVYDGHMRAGTVAMNNKQFEKAILHFRDALRIAPNDQLAKSSLRDAEEGLKKDKEHRDDYQRLVQRAKNALQNKRYEEAIKAADDAMFLYPLERDAQLLKKQAEDGLRQASYEQAIKDGDAAMAAKNYKAAVGFFQKALQEKPGDLLATQRLGQARNMAK